MGTRRNQSPPLDSEVKKPRKIMCVVEGLESGNPRMDRLHVILRRGSHWVSYRGWTDTVRHTKWYYSSRVGATPESALKKGLRCVQTLHRMYGSRAKKYQIKADSFGRMTCNVEESLKQLVKLSIVKDTCT